MTAAVGATAVTGRRDHLGVVARRRGWSRPGPVMVGAAAGLALSSLLLVSCGGGSSTRTVKVVLREFSVTSSVNRIKSGTLTFEVQNAGTQKHEMVLVRATSADQLPRKPDGSIDEDKIPTGDKVGETGELDPQTTKNVTFTMGAGTYIMFCNIVTAPPSPVSHFHEGMHMQFTVNT